MQIVYTEYINRDMALKEDNTLNLNNNNGYMYTLVN